MKLLNNSQFVTETVLPKVMDDLQANNEKFSEEYQLEVIRYYQ